MVSMGTSWSQLVESNVPTLRIGRVGERTVVASALVAALLVVPAASSSGLIQADDDIPGHVECAGSHCSELAPRRHAAPQVARVHAIYRMMQQMQFCSL